eukprot:11176723-Lingulodinium_polyedra.AAC.1
MSRRRGCFRRRAADLEDVVGIGAAEGPPNSNWGAGARSRRACPSPRNGTEAVAWATASSRSRVPNSNPCPWCP